MVRNDLLTKWNDAELLVIGKFITTAAVYRGRWLASTDRCCDYEILDGRRPNRKKWYMKLWTLICFFIRATTEYLCTLLKGNATERPSRAHLIHTCLTRLMIRRNRHAKDKFPMARVGKGVFFHAKDKLPMARVVYTHIIKKRGRPKTLCMLK